MTAVQSVHDAPKIIIEMMREDGGTEYDQIKGDRTAEPLTASHRFGSSNSKPKETVVMRMTWIAK